MPRKLPRLFVNTSLSPSGKFTLPLKQSHYLSHVLRMTLKDSLLLFNGHEGEWQCEIINNQKKYIDIEVKEMVRPQNQEIPLFLFFAPLKSGPLSFLIEKATELGVTDLQPVWSERTQGRDFNHAKYLLIAQEAAEQCERLTIPSLHMPLSLKEVLTKWDHKKRILVCDERRESRNLFEMLEKETDNMDSVMIGPEGGFSPAEFNWLEQYPQFTFISLGENILRAETASLCALSLMYVKNSLKSY
jgi:16S rRNA (uracil1498-N3)-methyltransferase